MVLLLILVLLRMGGRPKASNSISQAGETSGGTQQWSSWGMHRLEVDVVEEVLVAFLLQQLELLQLLLLLLTGSCAKHIQAVGDCLLPGMFKLEEGGGGFHFSQLLQ